MTVDPRKSEADAGTSIRAMALHAGDLHGKIIQSLAPLAKLSEEELLQRAETDLIKVRDRGLLTDPEMQQLLNVFRVIRTNSSPRQKFDQVDGILQQIKAADGSPVALLIAAVAADSSRGAAERSEAAGVDASHGLTVAADIAGGVGGVFIGDELCGPVCALMGGVAGAAGLSMLAADYL